MGAFAFFAVLTAGNYELLSKSTQLHASPENPPPVVEAPRVSASKKVISISKNQTKNVDIGCASKGSRTPQSVSRTKRFISRDSLMMLRGKSCLSDAGFQFIQIRNATNGFTASIFEKASTEFQTDFIQLNEGLNEVVFELENQKGEKFTETVYFELNS